MKKGINFDKVSLKFDDGGFNLKDVDLFIPPGSFVGVVGNNGSGKSTLIQLINGLIPSQIKAEVKGKITVDGVDTTTRPVSYFADRVGMVFQNPDFMIFNLTVREEIDFGLNNLKMDKREERMKRALTEVGMEGYEDRDPQTLSLGQKQKICLAAVLALDTPYIVLDEPTAMLDHKSSLRLFEILKNLKKKGKTIIIVEHDTEYLKGLADTIVVMDQGEVVMQGSPREVFSHKGELKKIGIKVPSF